MSDDNEPKDESTDDSEQQAEQQPTDSDQAAAQAEEQPSDTDQAAEQTEEQPADSDEPPDQAQEQPAESDQPADQTEGQPAEGDQPADQAEDQATDSDQPTDQSEEQPADSDQPATAASADNTLAFPAGAPSRGGGAGLGGPGKTTKVQVIAKFMTNSANDPFKEGSITMNVFDGEKGTLLWKLGSMDQQKVTFQEAVLTSNVIKSAMFSEVTGNSVKVELRVKMLQGDHEANPQIPEVNFGTAAKFELPAKGPLNVDVDVEVTEKEFTVDATDESSAGDAARPMLANIEEIHLSHVKSVTNVGAGKFRVVFRIPTKKILILHPATLELIY